MTSVRLISAIKTKHFYSIFESLTVARDILIFKDSPFVNKRRSYRFVKT